MAAKDISKIVQPILSGNADIVIGSRYLIDVAKNYSIFLHREFSMRKWV